MQVWNKQRKDEILIDVDDVALGHETRMRWNKPGEWVWSAQAVHDSLVNDEDFNGSGISSSARDTGRPRHRRSCTKVCVRGGTRTITPRGIVLSGRIELG